MSRFSELGFLDVFPTFASFLQIETIEAITDAVIVVGIFI